MNKRIIAKPQRNEEGNLIAVNIVTNEPVEDGLIRDIQIQTAFRNKQLLEYDPARKKPVRRVSEELQEEFLESETKLCFFKEQKERDPEIMFNNLRRLTKMVAKGIQPSLVVTGDPGLGKTYVVKETLEKSGLKESYDFVHFKGRASSVGLFVTLYENSDKIIVLDDCDSVFRDDDAVNMLKSALDSYDRRFISNLTSKQLKDQYDAAIPRTFEFTGQIIFITNIPMQQLDPAIRSRSFVADISMTTSQMFKRMAQLSTKIEPTIPQAAKDKALSIMQDLQQKYQGVEVNLRSFIKAARVTAMNFEENDIMIAEQIIASGKD